MEDVRQIKTVSQYCELYDIPQPRSPLVCVTHSPMRKTQEPLTLNLGVYQIIVKENKGCVLSYGRTVYDYDEGTIVSLAPGQTITTSPVSGVTHKSTGIVFSPDLIVGTQLERQMSDFGFFSYSSSEALHPSAQERQTVLDCMAQIEAELTQTPDRLSRRLTVCHIEILLNYCLRFYERQFDSRKELNHSAISKFEHLLDRYFDEGRAETIGLPTVGYFADKICLTANYFGDMVKRETGISPKELINRKVLSLAKSRMLEPDASVKETAFSLGFQYPQHFVRFFKKETGLTPSEYVRSVD